ncbi:MAG: zinc ABC transporter substrate-binding protein [Simkaniaceae bacterium]|nr:zinc ABC transporter substrate-binding protein [Simkaniaceae bacterium]
MKRWFAIVLLCFGCSSKGPDSEISRWMMEKERPKVLSTTGIVGDLVKQIGGVQIVHTTLIEGELDPHTYELVKGDSEKLSCADLIFANGLGLEHGASLHAYLEESDKVHQLASTLPQKDLIKIDGQWDPHVWMDVSLWMQTANGVAERLAEKLPEHAETFRERARTVMAALNKLDSEMCALFKAIPEERRYLVTSHDAFNYFAKRYLSDGEDPSERFFAPEGLSPDGRLTTGDIERILNCLKRFGIGVVFPESNVSLDSLEKVVASARRLGIEVRLSKQFLYGDALGEKGTDQETYIGMMRYNAAAICGAMHDL